MGRLVRLVGAAALAACALVPLPPAVAGCGPEGASDDPAYAFAWYACRRAESLDPGALPHLDPGTGELTVCLDRFHGQSKKPDCRRVDMLSGTGPTKVCLPTGPATMPMTPCIPVPALDGGSGGDPGTFPYEDFQVCDRNGSNCQSTFWSTCLSTSAPDGPRHIGCVGAGVQFTDPNHPERGVAQVCVAVGTPADPPNTWTITCAPLDRRRAPVKVHT